MSSSAAPAAPAAPPAAPRKHKKTMSRGRQLLKEEGPQPLLDLQRSGRKVAYKFRPNEHVELFELTPIEEHMARTNLERSAANVRAGMVTPPRQIKNTSALARSPKMPPRPVKKRKTRRSHGNSRTRKNY